MKTIFIFLTALLLQYDISAQVKYTLLTPPKNIIDSFVIDINSDGIPDFILKHTQKKELAAGAEAVNFTDDYISLVPLNFNAFTQLPLDFGSMINKDQKWCTVPADLLWTSHIMLRSKHVKICKHGPWIRTADNYIGVQLNLNGQFFYGWIRIEAANNATSVTIYDFAFTDKPMLGIFCNNAYSIRHCLSVMQFQLPVTEMTVTGK
ncbi:MAG: hypothetical protein H0W62_13850 [Chitinophagales bacterium]|nr:hypothetical protein [Chitinophagales bacterium]